MTRKQKYYIKSVALPLTTALIWGLAFVVQAEESGGILAFNGGRSVFAVIFLFFLVLIRKKGKVKKVFCAGDSAGTKKLWKNGILLGLILFVAQFTQQAGLYLGSNPGKTAFVTAFYVVLVPVLGVFFGKKTNTFTYLAILIALIGLYFICVKDGFHIEPLDGVIILSAFCYAFHILLVSRSVEQSDPVQLSLIQFLVIAVVGLAGSFLFEDGTIESLRMDFFPLLYLGFFSSGIAFTLQNVAEQGTNPTLVSLGLSMESVFGLLFSMLILHRTLSLREYIGCGMMFLAILVANLFSDIDVKKMIKKRRGKQETYENRSGL